MRRVEALSDFASNWSPARSEVTAELAELAALASGCATTYREQEAALARGISVSAEEVVIRPPAPAVSPALAGPGGRLLRFPAPPGPPSSPYPWSRLAEVNPVRGDPWAVQGLAGYLGARAVAVDDLAGALERVQAEQYWTGPAADAFRERRSEAVPRLRRIEARDEGAQRALNRYAPALEGAQEEADRARRRAESAQVRIAEAQRELEQQQELRDAALRSGAPLPVMLVDWQGHLEDAHRAMAAARRLLDDAVSDWEQAAGVCARAIAATVDDELRDPRPMPWESLARVALDRFPAIREAADWVGKASGALGIAAALTAAIPIVGQVVATAALVAGGLSLLANSTLWLAGEGSIVPVVLDVINIATLGTARAATAAARGSVGATARWQAAELKGVAGRALVRQGPLLPTAQGLAPVTISTRPRVMSELGKLAHQLGIDEATTLVPSLKSWRRALPVWRRLEIPAPELLEISSNAMRQARLARGAGTVGTLLDIHDTGALGPLERDLSEGLEALRQRGWKP